VDQPRPARDTRVRGRPESERVVRGNPSATDVLVSAFVFGVASAYLAIGVLVVEEQVFPSLRSDPSARFLDVVFGVGLREEVAKGLFALPLLLGARRWGGRREALACEERLQAKGSAPPARGQSSRYCPTVTR
jgi:hypothetical protein